MAQLDLLLLHPPSVYDFRTKAILYGPVSDLIPSSPVFEMYPLGFLTLTDYLERQGWRVRVVNLAVRMMDDRTFDVEAFLRRIPARAIGIDLHWLPHAHGALEVAALVKRLHPLTPVIVGGLSATYFHRELIDDPAVDFVLRGDTTEPAFDALLQTIEAGSDFAQVPNLTWKDAAGVHVNPMTCVPASLDLADLSPARFVRMVVRHRDLRSVVPFQGWWRAPITAVITVKGCASQCVTCGSSRSGCALVSLRPQPAFRSPASLVANIAQIAAIVSGPIFLVGDLLQAGEAYAHEVLERLRGARISNEIMFEFFDLPPVAFLEAIDAAVPRWSIEISPESHDPAVRLALQDGGPYSNEELETVIHAALALRCLRLDLFFMIGLPQQTPASVMETIGYCEHLFQSTDDRLSCFISPLGPFVDPGSQAFEEPESMGYRLFARTLAEHRALLVQPSWEQILNYETEWMTRAELTEVTYLAAEALNNLKVAYGRIDPAIGAAAAQRIQQARVLKTRLAAAAASGTHDADAEAQLRGDVHAFSVSTVCDKRELFAPQQRVGFRPLGVLRALAGGWGRKARRPSGPSSPRPCL